MVAQAVVYPLDTLKFRTQCETVSGAPKGNALIVATARKMWRTTGVAGYYRGLPMGLIGMFPYSAIDLFAFENLKQMIVKRNMRLRNTKHEEDALPSNFSLALIGAFSGAIGASVVYPINLLRTRLQSQGTTQHPRTYTGVFDVTRQTIQGEGVRGLFKGLTPNLLKVVPSVSIVSPHQSSFGVIGSGWLTYDRPMSYTKTPRERCTSHNTTETLHETLRPLRSCRLGRPCAARCTAGDELHVPVIPYTLFYLTSY